MTRDINEEMMEALNELEGIFVIDLYKQSLLLPDQIKQALIDETPGYYIPGIVKPILTKRDNGRCNVSIDNGKNFISTSIDELIRISKINREYFRNITIEYNGKNIHGNLFLQYFKDLSTTPSKSLVQMKFVKEIILDFLYQACRQNNHSFRKYYNYVKPEYIDLIETYNFGDDLREVIESLNKFISRHTNHLYFHKELGANLIIEKSVDYRVYEYYKLLQKINPPEYL